MHSYGTDIDDTLLATMAVLQYKDLTSFSLSFTFLLSSDSPFTFTVSILFSTDNYWYMVQ